MDIEGFEEDDDGGKPKTPAPVRLMEREREMGVGGGLGVGSHCLLLFLFLPLSAFESGPGVESEGRTDHSPRVMLALRVRLGLSHRYAVLCWLEMSTRLTPHAQGFSIPGRGWRGRPGGRGGRRRDAAAHTEGNARGRR